MNLPSQLSTNGLNDWNCQSFHSFTMLETTIFDSSYDHPWKGCRSDT